MASLLASANPQPPLGSQETASLASVGYAPAVNTLSNNPGPLCTKCKRTKYYATNVGIVVPSADQGGCNCEAPSKDSPFRATFRPINERQAIALEQNTAVMAGVFHVLKAIAANLGADVAEITIPEAAPAAPSTVPFAADEKTGVPLIDGLRGKQAALAQMA